MPWYTVHYQFSQRFPFPVEEAYAWATDYNVDDIGRMGLEGKREIVRVDKDTLVLEDTFFSNGRVKKKRRLVRLYPELHTLTNTRLSGPNKHSQFLYRFVAEGESASRLDFTGAQLNNSKTRPVASKLAKLASDYAKEDSAIWVNLAEAMKKDLGARP